MLVTKINAFSGSKISNQRTENRQANNMTALNKNAVDSFTFKGGKQRFLPEDLIPNANTVVQKFLGLEAPVRAAENVLSSTKATAAEREAAEEIRKKGVTFEDRVTIAGKSQICKVNIGNYKGGSELCMDVGKNGAVRRYRISLDSDKKVTNSSEMRVQVFGENGYPSDFVSLGSQKVYNKTISAVKTLLEAFSK